MNKILKSIKTKPINLFLIIAVLILYIINNAVLKKYTTGIFQYFFKCHFNDFICPLLFISYSNILLITIGKEITRFRWIILYGFCSGLIWEFIAPLLKSNSVTDLLDLIFYLLGSCIYWALITFFKGTDSYVGS